jgi:hypothetical protein
MQDAEQALLFFETKNFNVPCLQRRPVWWRRWLSWRRGWEEYQNGSILFVPRIDASDLNLAMDGGAVFISKKVRGQHRTKKKKNDDCSLSNERYNCTGG